MMVFCKASNSLTGIVMSSGMSFLGAYITTSLGEQYRLCSINGARDSKVFSKRNLLLLMALSLGGICVWSMHFIEMATMILEAPDGTHITINFHIFSTIIALAFSIFLAWVGLYIAAKDVTFSKSKKEIVEMFVENASKLSMKQIRQIKASQIIQIIGTHSLQHVSVGGLVCGAGMIIMHYVGMEAMDFEGTIVYNIGVIAASVILAVVASILSFWILFRLLSIYPHLESLRIVSAGVMALAVVGVHYVGMSASKFDYLNKASSLNHIENTTEGAVHEKDAFNGALIGSIITVMILVVMTLTDLRTRLADTTVRLGKADKLLQAVHDKNYSPDAISNYLIRIHHSCASNTSEEVRSKPATGPKTPGTSRKNNNSSIVVSTFEDGEAIEKTIDRLAMQHIAASRQVTRSNKETDVAIFDMPYGSTRSPDSVFISSVSKSFLTVTRTAENKYACPDECVEEKEEVDVEDRHNNTHVIREVPTRSSVDSFALQSVRTTNTTGSDQPMPEMQVESEKEKLPTSDHEIPRADFIVLQPADVNTSEQPVQP